MAVDSFMIFEEYDGTFLESESQVDPAGVKLLGGYAGLAGSAADHRLFEITDWAFDVVQTLNIGSQSTGAAAGKITFNPLSVTRRIDQASPKLFQQCASGTPFRTVVLAERKSAGGASAGVVYLQWVFKLVAVKTISWASDVDQPKETVTFEYGGLQMLYAAQKPDGSLGQPVVSGWNRVENVNDVGTTPIQ